VPLVATLGMELLIACHCDSPVGNLHLPRFLVVAWVVLSCAIGSAWLLHSCFRISKVLSSNCGWQFLSSSCHTSSQSSGLPQQSQKASSNNGYSWTSADQDFQTHVRKAVQKMKAQRFRAFAGMWVIVNPPMMAWFAWTVWTTYWHDPDGYTQLFQDQLWFEGLLGLLLSVLAAHVFRSKSLEIGLLAQTLMMISFSARLFVVAKLSAFHQAWSYIALVRIMFAFSGSPFLTAALNSLFLACELYIMIYNEIPDYLRAVVTYLVVCFFAGAVERSLESEACALLHAREARDGQSRIHGILSYLCDAVVELDEALVICGRSLSFEAIVMHGANCQGRTFTDFCFDEDQVRLAQTLQSNPAGTVNSCTVKLVVPPFNAIDVTLWHTCSLRLDGRKRYLIGLQEQQEDTRCASLPLRAEPWQRKARATRGRRRKLSRSSAPPQPQREALESSDSLASSAVESDTAIVTVDVGQADLPILELTLGAQLLLGPSVGVGSCLARYMPHVATLVCWMQETYNYFLAGDTDQALQMNSRTVVLQTHDSPNPVPFRCSLVFVDSDFESDASQPVLTLRLVFTPLDQQGNRSNQISVLQRL